VILGVLIQLWSFSSLTKWSQYVVEV
jgi:hypothetical protein